MLCCFYGFPISTWIIVIRRFACLVLSIIEENSHQGLTVTAYYNCVKNKKLIKVKQFGNGSGVPEPKVRGFDRYLDEFFKSG